MSTGLWVNASNGQCLSAPQNDRAPMITAPCDPNNTRQQITINGDGQGISTVGRNNNSGTVDTWNGNVYWSGECGKGNDCSFHVYPILSQEPFPSGAFKWYGWGRQGGHDAAVQSDGSISQNGNFDGQPAAIWIPFSLALNCNTFEIPLSQCSNAAVASAKSNCGQGNNATKPGCLNFCQNNPSQCQTSLTNYCNDPSNVTSSYCLNTFCPQNPGSCDSGMASYCASHLSDDSLCACFADNAFANLPPTLQANPTLSYYSPVCWNTKCGAGSSYMTTSAKAAVNSCPKCIQVQNFSNIGASAVNFKNISQSCSVQTTNQTVTSPATTQDASPPVTRATFKVGNISMNTQQLGLAGAGFFLCALLLILVVVLAQQST